MSVDQNTNWVSIKNTIHARLEEIGECVNPCLAPGQEIPADIQSVAVVDGSNGFRRAGDALTGTGPGVMQITKLFTVHVFEAAQGDDAASAIDRAEVRAINIILGIEDGRWRELNNFRPIQHQQTRTVATGWKGDESFAHIAIDFTMPINHAVGGTN